MILSAGSASEAKALGRKAPICEEWELRKLELMENLVRLKFSIDPLKSLLLDTGDEELVEGNYWGDTFWGVCDGVGENNLGKILMKVRSELRSKEVNHDLDIFSR